MVASNVHISLSCVVRLLFSFMVYFISWCLLMCYFMFIYVHLLSFIFIYFHFFLFIFMPFHFCSFPVFFSLEKTITNLNHLHVDPRLSSADRKCFFCFFFFCFAGSAPSSAKAPSSASAAPFLFPLCGFIFCKAMAASISFSPCFGASFASSSAGGRFSGAASDCGPASEGATGAAFGGGACLR